MIQKLGKYAIVEKLGEGAMGAVYKAYDEILDRYVAIKTMAEDIKWDPELKLRFYREARSAAGLHHPNIVTIHDLGEEGKITYIVMELLQGRDLKDVIRERSPLSLEKKLSIIAQVSDGLQHAHLAGIVHRDIKPGNIHFSTTGNIKIVDFGIARIPSSDLTRSGVRLGTPIYMSPEQIRGEASDERSDMFSTGIVFYELVTYSHPFRDKNVAKTVDNILFQNHFPFAELSPEAPPGLWQIISTCMAKEPGKRYPAMGDVARACRGLLVDLNVGAQKMAGELSGALPRLQHAASRPDAPARVAGLLQQARDLLGQEEKRDYASLKRILAEIEGEPVLLRTAVPVQARRDEAVPAAPPPKPAAPAPPVAPPPKPAAPAPPGAPLPAPDEVQKRARRDALIEKARQSLASHQYTAAVTALNEALQLDPSHSEASDLRRRAVAEAEAERALQARKAEGEREKAAGLRFLREGKFRESMAPLQKAAELLSGDPEVQNAIHEAEEKARAEELRQQVQAELAGAAELLRTEAFDKARERARHAIQISPGNSEAADLLARIDRAEEQKRRTAEISSLLGQTRDNLSRQDFEAAYARARKALDLDPANADAQGLIRSIDDAKEAKRRKDQFDEALGQGREALARGDFADATRLGNDALAIEPGSPAAAEFLRSVTHAEEQKRRHDEVARWVSQGQRAFLRDELEEAEKCAREALAVDPEHAAKAKELLQRIDDSRQRKRREEIAAIVARGRQVLGTGALEEAAEIGQQALRLDAESVETRNFLAAVDQAQESKRQKEIAAALERGRQALERGAFDEAVREAESVSAMDPRNKEAHALLKDIKAGRRRSEKAEAQEKKRLEKESKREEKEARQLEEKRQSSPSADMDSAGELDRTVLLVKPASRKFPKGALWIAAAVVVVLAAVIVVWKMPRRQQAPPDPSAQLAAAQASLDSGMLDEAIAVAEQVIATYPDNAPAQALLVTARQRKTEKEIETLLMEAQSLRSQGSPHESLIVLAKLLTLDPANEAALTVRSQIEAELTASKSASEQDAAIRQWLAAAERLIAGGKLNEAKAELDKVARVRPAAPELKSLRRRMTTQTDETSRLEKEKFEAAQKRNQIEALHRQGDTLVRQGRYSEALAVLDQWIAAEPQNSQARDLQARASQAQQATKAFESLMAERLYDEALKSVAQLEKINPADPGIAEMRRRAEGRKASARAVLSIFRLGPAAKITLDDEPIGSEGEVDNRTIAAGRHKLTVENAAGRQASRTLDFVDGQTAAFVYDSAAPELRPMVDTDRALLSMRRIREEVHDYEVEHRHMIGRCTGTLRISGLGIEYRASEKNHSFNRPLSSLKLKINNDRLEMDSADGKGNWNFKVRDAVQAKEILGLWEKLQKLGK